MENSKLTVADLASLKNLLTAAFSRGAFRVDEASAVGAIYDRLDAFLAEQTSANMPMPDQVSTQGETNA